MMVLKKTFQEKTYNLPVIVVRDIVVFPNTLVPIFVGRDKSIKALNQALMTGGDVFVMSQRDNNYNDDIDISNLPRIGTICKIAQSLKLPDGTMKVIFDCICRANAVRLIDNEYILAELELTKQTIEQDNDEIYALMKQIKDNLLRYVRNNEKISEDIYQNLISINEPEAFCDILASRFDFPISFKIDLLQDVNLISRLSKISRVIDDENNLNKLQKELKKITDRNIEKNNREYYLQEQMKVIKKELGDSDNPMDIGEKYEKKIKEKQLPEKVATKVKEEVKRLKYLGAMSSEAGVIRGYLDTIFDLPWTEKSELKTDIKGAEKYLNESHYGMEKAKERILESIAVQIKTGEQPKKTILCLYGAPGVGKTSLAEAMAKATGREFVKVALGGVGDTVPTGADTDGRAEPLAQINIRSKTDLAQAVAFLEDGVDTGAKADERVVKGAVGHIRATDDLASLIAVGILLRVSVEGEQEACSSKDSDEFDDFHNTMLS